MLHGASRGHVGPPGARTQERSTRHQTHTNFDVRLLLAATCPHIRIHQLRVVANHGYIIMRETNKPKWTHLPAAVSLLLDCCPAVALLLLSCCSSVLPLIFWPSVAMLLPMMQLWSTELQYYCTAAVLHIHALHNLGLNYKKNRGGMCAAL